MSYDARERFDQIGGDMRQTTDRPKFIEALKANGSNASEFRELLSNTTFKNYNYYITMQQFPSFSKVESKLNDLYDLCTSGHLTKNKLQYALWISVALNQHYYDGLYDFQKTTHHNSIVRHYERLRWSAQARERADDINLLLNPVDRDRSDDDKEDITNAGEVLDPFQMNRDIIKAAKPWRITNCFRLFCCEAQFADDDWYRILERKLHGSNKTAASRQAREELAAKHAQLLAQSQTARRQLGVTGARNSRTSGWVNFGKGSEEEKAPLLDDSGVGVLPAVQELEGAGLPPLVVRKGRQ